METTALVAIFISGLLACLVGYALYTDFENLLTYIVL